MRRTVAMKKERYHRIASSPTTVEPLAGLTVPVVPSTSSSNTGSTGSVGGGDTSIEDNPSSLPVLYASTSPDGGTSNRRVAMRRHDSRGSYSSVAAADHPGDDLPRPHEPDLLILSTDREDHHDDHDNHDLPSHMREEKSPLNRSFVSDEGSSSTPRLTLNAVKFALEDDEDDDFDVHLRRYAIDFGKNRTVLADPPTRILPFLWWHVQTARQQARQRRAQLLLQQSERRWRQSLYICLVTTLCDATDAGIALAAAAMLLWILALWKMELMRNSLLLGGLFVWTIRFGARPAREYWIQQRLRQYRPRQTQPRYNDNFTPATTTGTSFAFAQPPTTTTTTTTATMEMSPVPHHPSSQSGKKATTTATTTAVTKDLSLHRTDPTMTII